MPPVTLPNTSLMSSRPTDRPTLASFVRKPPVSPNSVLRVQKSVAAASAAGGGVVAGGGDWARAGTAANSGASSGKTSIARRRLGIMVVGMATGSSACERDVGSHDYNGCPRGYTCDREVDRDSRNVH